MVIVTVAQIKLWIKMIIMQTMECHPYSLSIDDGVFTIAFNVLEQVARENRFAIHNVPYDGDCLFSIPAGAYYSMQCLQEHTEANGSRPLGK